MKAPAPSATPAPPEAMEVDAPTQAQTALLQEEIANMPAEQLVQRVEAKMKIWEGPGSDGWMNSPKVCSDGYTLVLQMEG